MKRIIQLSIAASIILMQSCTGGNSHSDEQSMEQESATQTGVEALPQTLQRGTQLLDLSDYFMPFSLYIPDSSRGIPNIIETSYGETEIEVGSTFHIVVAEGGDMAMKKVEIADDLMFTNDVVEEGDDFILYKSSIADSHLDPEYHFYAVKTVDGLDFEFRDFSNEGGYAETVARFMLASVNHLVPKSVKNPS